MTNFRQLSGSREGHGRLVTLATIFLLLSGYFCAAQTPVVLAPIPRLQFLDNSGRPLAFGCVFTYKVGTTTPLATYTDNTGATQNSEPVILASGGYANIWLAAGQAYTFRVASAGGSNCASGTTLYTVNGIGGGATVLTTVVTYSATPSFQDASQIQLFTITLTGNASAQPMTFVGVTPPGIIYFQITQDASGSHTWAWPSNVIGGCTIGSAANAVTTQEFIYNGTNATAVGPCTIGAGPAIDTGNIVASGTITGTQLISTIATGTAPLVVSSTTQVANLNVSQLEGKTWEAPGTIGSTTPNSGVFTTLQANTSLTLNGGTAQTATQGTDTSLLTSGTMTGSTGVPLCKDANAGASTSCTGLIGGVNQFVTTSGCTSNGSICTVSTNWPSSFADTTYFVECTPTSQASASAAVFWISTKNTGSFVISINNAGTNNPGGFGSFDCWGHHN